MSQLTAACMRISIKAGIDDIVQAVVDEARSITGARAGAVVMLPADGASGKRITSGREPLGEKETGGSPAAGGESTEGDSGHGTPPAAGRPGVGVSAESRADEGQKYSRLELPISHGNETYGVMTLEGKDSGGRFNGDDREFASVIASFAGLSIANARARSAERRSRADMDALIATIPMGVLVFDGKTGALISSNEAASRLMGGQQAGGITLGRLLGSVRNGRGDGREDSSDEAPLNRVLNSGESLRSELMEVKPPEAPAVSTVFSVTPVSLDGEGLVSVVVALQEAGPGNALDRTGEGFLGTVSQYLRTPLTTIKGSAATVLGASPPLDLNETQQFFRIIDRQADYMRELISNLLDLSKLEAGSLVLSPASVALPDLLQEARDLLRGSAAGREISVELEADLPPVWADRQRVAQVLNNLLSAVARHCGEGEFVRVAVRREGDRVAVSVAAEPGGGRSRGMQARSDYLSSADNEREAQRLSLGFAVCKTLVESQGGTIRTDEPSEGKGVRYTFTLPVAGLRGDSDESGRAETGDDKALRPPNGMRVLAVDSDPEVLRYVQATLDEAGYAVTATSDPEEANRLIDSVRPHLVLMDLELPGDEGLQIIERVPRSIDAPVIFLSTPGTGNDIGRAFEMGGDDHIVKPFLSNELTARVNAALSKQTALARGRTTEPFRVDDLEVDYTERRVTVAGQEVNLTATEYRLLFELAVSAGRVLTHGQLLERVWGPSYTGDARIVRAFIKSLRRKLGDDATHPRYVRTEPRVGYRMAKPNP